MPENLKNSAVATGLEKFNFHSNHKKKGKAKECSNYCMIAFISLAHKVMIKNLQAMLQQYVNCELPDVQSGFRKDRGTRDQIASICWIIGKARQFQKISISASLTTLKPLIVLIITNWKILSDRNTRLPYLSPEKLVCRTRSTSQNWILNRLAPDWERNISRLYIVTLLI